MRIGVSFPTTEIADPLAIRDYVQAVEGLGFDYITLIDHVLQSKTALADPYRAFYALHNMFHEPFILMGFMAAATTRLELSTAILILPQRQTALVAKQAAEIDVLSKGRLRLGVGIGWSKMEFDGLDQRFENRGRRVKEQIEFMRALWTNESITFDGKWHKIKDAGINPLPVQQPIPVWIGATADKPIERAGQIADGWIANPRVRPDDDGARNLETFRNAAREAGRDCNALGVEGTVFTGGLGSQAWAADTQTWDDFGATNVTIRSTLREEGAEPMTTDEHINVLRQYRAARPSV